MLTVSLEDVIRSGSWGPLKLGVTADELRSTVGPPDVTGCPDPRGFDAVWNYGDIEVLFDEDGAYCIDLHGVTNRPQGGSVIRLDPWILRAGLPFEEFEDAIGSIGIGWRREIPAYDPTQLHVVLRDDPRLYLSFVTTDEEYSPPKGWWGLFLVRR